MNKSNRKYDLLQEELEDFLEPGESNFKSRLMGTFYKLVMKNRSVQYSFLVPSSYYLRGELLCEDVTIENDGMPYTHADLINLLFQDFLENVRILSDHNRIYSELMARDNRPPIICNYGKTVKSQSSTESPIDTCEIECVFKRRQALHLEVFLADLSELYPDNPLSVEDVLQIIYCDFIKAYKSGQLKNIVERIIKFADKN